MTQFTIVNNTDELFNEIDKNVLKATRITN